MKFWFENTKGVVHLAQLTYTTRDSRVIYGIFNIEDIRNYERLRWIGYAARIGKKRNAHLIFV
jgi:hypothetical protein